MKGSLAILLFFLLGCASGVYYHVDFDIHQLSVSLIPQHFDLN